MNVVKCVYEFIIRPWVGGSNGCSQRCGIPRVTLNSILLTEPVITVVCCHAAGYQHDRFKNSLYGMYYMLGAGCYKQDVAQPGACQPG